jgi:hypothetical protein
MSNLPARYVDLARYGVTDSDLRRAGDRAVYNALVRVAMSAVNADWDYGRFAVFIAEPRSNLGQQARLRHGKPVESVRYERMLRAAWTRAAERVEGSQKISKLDVDERVRDLRWLIEDADTDLNDAERAVLGHACDIAAKIGTLTPAMPWRAVKEATGLGEKSTKNTLARLTERGLLRVASLGKRGAGSKVATCYHLPLPEHVSERLPLAEGSQQGQRGSQAGTPAEGAPYSVPETGPMGPPGQTYGTPHEEHLGTPGQTYGTPADLGIDEAVPTVGQNGHNAPMTEAQTATVNMDPAMLAAFMEFYAARRQADGEPLPDNVIPLRRRSVK